MVDVTQWIGRQDKVEDVIDPRPARYLAATLGRKVPLEDGDALPPLWHWAYFVDARPPSELGRDGHPARGGFLPPVALPRRMWAGGRFTFARPLRIGKPARKVSTIANVVEKQGRSGALCFVTVRHEVSQADAVCFVEEHDIVYREDPAADAPVAAPAMAPETAEWSEDVTPSPVLLYRYSAATFNGHRIHYDPEYARQVEGYEGFAPIAGPAPFAVQGLVSKAAASLWARRADGAVAMDAQAVFEP